MYPQKIEEVAENIIVIAETTPIADSLIFRSSEIAENSGGNNPKTTLSNEADKIRIVKVITVVRFDCLVVIIYFK